MSGLFSVSKFIGKSKKAVKKGKGKDAIEALKESDSVPSTRAGSPAPVSGSKSTAPAQPPTPAPAPAPVTTPAPAPAPTPTPAVVQPPTVPEPIDTDPPVIITPPRQPSLDQSTEEVAFKPVSEPQPPIDTPPSPFVTVPSLPKTNSVTDLEWTQVEDTRQSEDSQGKSADSPVPVTAADEELATERVVPDVPEPPKYNLEFEEKLKALEETHERELSKLKSDFASQLQASSDIHQREVSKLNERKTTLEGLLKDMEAAVKKMQGDLKARDIRLSGMSEQLSQSGIVIAALEKQKSQMQGDAAEQHNELLEEIKQLDQTLAAQRSSHRETLAEVEKDKEGLRAELDVQKQQIDLLERKTLRMEKENSTLKSQIRLHEDELLARRSRESTSVAEVTTLEMTTRTLAGRVVELEEKLVASQKQNDILLGDLSVQSNELQLQQRHAVGNFWSKQSVSSLPLPTSDVPRRTPTMASESRLEQGVRLTRILNEEIYQVAASLADHAESIVKLEHSLSPALSTIATSTASTILGAMIGPDLVRTLRKDAAKDPAAEDYNPFYVQAALQGGLTALISRTVSSWYPPEPSHGIFLAGIYERIKGLVGWQNANHWRHLTLQACSSRIQRHEQGLLSELKTTLSHIFLIAGWAEPTHAGLLEPFSATLSQIVKLTLRLHDLRAVHDIYGQIEVRTVQPGDKFWVMTMCDDNALDSDDDNMSDAGSVGGDGGVAQPKQGPHFNEPVVCTVALGLDYAQEKMKDGKLVQVHEMLLKPRVVLQEALD